LHRLLIKRGLLEREGCVYPVWLYKMTELNNGYRRENQSRVDIYRPEEIVTQVEGGSSFRANAN
jgi:hypothetical protein